MKNKILIAIIIILVLAIGIGVGVYLSGGKKSGIYGPEAGKGEVLKKDDFHINLPKGWAESTAPTGVSAMAADVNGETSDPNAKRVNFKTYYSVVYDSLGEKSQQEYFEYIKDSLSQAIPGIVFTKESIDVAGSQDAYFLEAELNQKEIDLKILIAAINGLEEKDMWLVSFNTTKADWDKYKDLFYQTAKSFRLQ